jgi:hypothetical protein
MKLRRCVLFLGLFFLLPVPIVVFGGRVPLARVAELAALCILVAAREGTGGPVKSMIFLFASEALAGAALCWLAAWLVERRLRFFPGRSVDLALFAVVVVAVVAALLFEVYVTPFGQAPQGNLWDALT